VFSVFLLQFGLFWSFLTFISFILGKPRWQHCNFSISTCFAIFELVKFMCFGLTLSYPHKEFLNPRPTRPAASSNPHIWWLWCNHKNVMRLLLRVQCPSAAWIEWGLFNAVCSYRQRDFGTSGT